MFLTISADSSNFYFAMGENIDQDGGPIMEKAEAEIIAKEVLYAMVTHREEFPAMIEFMGSEMDANDNVFINAAQVLFPREHIE